MSTTASTSHPLTEFYGGPMDGHKDFIQPSAELINVTDGHVYRFQPLLSSRRGHRVMISEHLTSDKRHAQS